MERKQAIQEVASVFCNTSDYIEYCLAQLVEFRKRLSACGTTEESKAFLEDTLFSSHTDHTDVLIEAMIFEWAIGIKGVNDSRILFGQDGS